jgi:hypothetical protein
MEEDKRKEKGYLESESRISHRNILWYVYRALAEEVNITKETEGMILSTDNMSSR